MLGYTKPLYILPFDHKTSFIKKLFGYDYYHLTSEQKEQIIETRAIVFSGFEKAVEKGVPKESAAFLTDEEFGESVLRNAKQNGYIVMLSTEKSGQDEFDFQYEDFALHIEKYKPQFTKALIRYNPEGDMELNKRQAARLKTLSDYSHTKGYKFLLEPLIPATEAQLAEVFQKVETYDREIRPRLSVQMIEELRTAGVEPDIWKLEGMSEVGDYELVVAKAREGNRKDVSVVVLGRASKTEKVEHWLRLGAKVEGVTGFAVGRTVFYEPLEKWYKKEISRVETVLEIAENFSHFYSVFVDAKKQSGLLQ